MEGFIALLIMLALALVGAGPLAIILIVILFKKLGKIEDRLSRMERRTPEAMTAQAAPVEPTRNEPVWGGRGVTFPAAATAQTESTAKPGEPAPSPERSFESKPPFADMKELLQTQQREVKKEAAVPIDSEPAEAAVPPEQPIRKEIFAPMPFQRVDHPVPSQPEQTAKTGGLELKIGTRFILIAGIITVIFGVGFFLKYVYENVYFSPWARVAIVAVGGLVAIVAGEMSRRRNFEVVAKGITALGFALLYAAVFAGARVYALFSPQWAFVFSIAITALAMCYAVVLNEILIAFLSLLGGYLAPVIISTGQNLPIPLFSYVLALSAGAMGCAMFRRWRAVNWIAMTGTWLLYTAWFEKFYTSEQITMAVIWLTVFACLYLVLPILHSLVRRIYARGEDVVLVVVNSVAVFYYLFRILDADDQSKLALATALWGAAHLVLMFTALWRCRDDVELHASLGVLGIALITAALPMYLELEAALVGWTIEAIVLTFIGIRYRGLWTQVMAFLVSGCTIAGLLYHLPLHPEEDFRVFLNAPFGTWFFVAAGLIVCHLFWRFMSQANGEGRFAGQVLYVAGMLLLAAGLALEWHAHCRLHMLYATAGQSHFLQGMMILGILLVPVLLARPLCPAGELVKTTGVISAVFGAAFVAIAMMGVYHQAFKLFINVPFALAIVFLAVLFWAAWQLRKSGDMYELKAQLSSAVLVLGMLFFFVVLSEQMYLYWSCQQEYAGVEGNWQSSALRYTLIAWAVYGLFLLFAGIGFDKIAVRGFAFVVTAFSAIGLFFMLPLHRSDEFRLAYNAPFITWVIVTVSILAEHGLWRFMCRLNPKKAFWASQLYYTLGLLLLAIGAGFEWAEYCRWHLEPSSLSVSHLHLGLILLFAVTVLCFAVRPLAPSGRLVQTTGILTSLAGAVYAAGAMPEVYHKMFTLFFNWPFVIAVLFSLSMLIAAWFVRSAKASQPNRVLGAAMVLSAMVLVWILLSEQVYEYWYCRNAYGLTEIANWSFSAQMYMSVTWAVYAAVLMVIGFAARKAAVRWLSLVIFAVLLAKIFIVDTATLRTEYRIAAFITTGVILVAVSFLYQLLKNRGFFDALENKQLAAEQNKSDHASLDEERAE